MLIRDSSVCRLIGKEQKYASEEKENEKRNDIIYLTADYLLPTKIPTGLQLHSGGFLCCFIDDLFSNLFGQGI